MRLDLFGLWPLIQRQNPCFVAFLLLDQTIFVVGGVRLRKFSILMRFFSWILTLSGFLGYVLVNLYI